LNFFLKHNNKRVRKILHILRCGLFLTLAIVFGCSRFQNVPSLEKEVKKPKAINESIETKWKISPLFQEGTKSLSSGLSDEGVESYLPKSSANTLPCLDEKTGKERGFLLADLESELISLSYSNNS
jgi:hypothetical protein